jgi:hypothetical protein
MVLIMEILDNMFLSFNFHGMVAVKNHTAGLKPLLAAAATGNLNAHTWDKELKQVCNFQNVNKF